MELTTIFDWLGILFGIMPLVAMLGILGRTYAEKRRWGTPTFCFIFAIFLVRLAYLRLATQGGSRVLGNPSNLAFSDVIGNSFIFCGLCIFMTITFFVRTQESINEVQVGEKLILAVKELGVEPEELIRNYKQYELQKGARIIQPAKPKTELHE